MWKKCNVIYSILLKTEEDYNEALKRINELYNAEQSTFKNDKLELLVVLVKLYEKDYFLVETPVPEAALILIISLTL